MRRSHKKREKEFRPTRQGRGSSLIVSLPDAPADQRLAAYRADAMASSI